MKFDKPQKLPLPKPEAKTANSFLKPPKHVDKFAIVTQSWSNRGVHFKEGDVVRISYNQRYVQHRDEIQAISVADIISEQRRYLGNQYIFYKDAIRYVDALPENALVKLMSKDYDIPVETKLNIISHKDGVVTVRYNGKLHKIHDGHIEGVPTHRFNAERHEPADYDEPQMAPEPMRYQYHYIDPEEARERMPF